MFQKGKFSSPEAHFYPGYFWYLDTKLDLRQLKAQLRDMAEHGARSVCLHPAPKRWSPNSNMEPDYLTDEWFRIIRELVEECRKLNMNWYLYDEGGFPSGCANGNVWDTDPEKMTRTYAVLDGKDSFKIIKEQVDPKTAVIPNLLVPEATPRFIELTHEAYAKLLKPYFGKTIRFTFMDEPVMPAIGYGDRLGWVDDLLPEFKKRKGYDLTPWVPAIIRREGYGAVAFDAGARACADYRDVMSQLFCERFLTPIREWCRNNGLLSGGHFGGEDEWFWARHCGYGHLVRALRGLDMPGVDMIWRQLYPGIRLHPFPKLASSVAHQAGQKAVMGEMFAVYGSGLQPGVMKYLIDYMLLCGINHFVFSNISVKHKGRRMTGCRPHFGPVDPLWKYFSIVHSYSARMCCLLSKGKPSVDTLLYFDMRPLWTGLNTAEYAICRGLKAADLLLESQRDFDYADDDLILSATVTGDGKLKCGKMTYSSLVIPNGSQLVPEAAARVDEFRSAGVRVLDMDSIEETAQTLRVEPATRLLRVSKQTFGKDVSYFVFNTSSREVRVKLYFAEKGPVSIVDGDKAEFYRIPSKKGVAEWTFTPWESRCFVIGYKEALPLPAAPSKEVLSLTDWTLCPVRRTSVGDDEFEFSVPDAKTVPAELGDWRKILGDTFSGDAVYCTVFRCKDPSRIRFLDLGKVAYACSLRINGKDVGMRFWGPYVFDIVGLLGKGENRIEITVTNTLANAISDGSLIRKYSRVKNEAGICSISYYESLQTEFEKDSLESGLFGPVRLMW